jgi:hypothetical protein
MVWFPPGIAAETGFGSDAGLIAKSGEAAGKMRKDTTRDAD